MAFDDALAGRVRQLVSSTPGLSEKRMFGGLAFLINGNMALGVHASELIVRIDPAETDTALARPGVRIFDLSGKPMKGWLLVSSSTLGDKNALASWVARGVEYARSLPAK